MATIYVDLENGDNSNDGYSFANRKKTLGKFDGGALHSSVLSAGDTVRIMGSPNPTLVGNGDVVYRHSHYLWDYDISFSNFSFSTTEGETVVTLNNHHLSTGDTIGITGTLDETGINGHWEITKVDDNSFKLNGFTALTTSAYGTAYMWDKTGSRIKLASAVTQNIASFGPRSTAWTASTNVTTSLKTNTNAGTQRDGEYTEHSSSDEIVVSSSFGTGKAAYFSTGTLDLSGYQQISFMVNQPSGTKATPDPLLPTSAGNYSLRLCSDTQGDTTVHTINFNVYSGSTESFRPITVDFGTNLNSSIQSIALYIDTDEGAQTIRLNNIIACKASSSADSLTLSSLIGLNTADDPIWYAIESINGTRVFLHCTTPQSSNAYTPLQDDNLHSSAYWSSSGTKSIYKRETIKTLMETNWSASASSRLYDHDSIQGTSSNRITISGGWNQTDMSTQTGLTFIDGTNSRGTALYGDSDYTTYEKLGFTRYYAGFFGSEDYEHYDEIHNVFCGYSYFSGQHITTLNNIYSTQCTYVNVGKSWNGTNTINKVWNVMCSSVSNYGNANSTCEEYNLIGCGSVSLPRGTTTTINIEHGFSNIYTDDTYKTIITNLNVKNGGRSSSTSAQINFRSPSSETTIIENLNDTTDQFMVGSTTGLRTIRVATEDDSNVQINGGTLKNTLMIHEDSTTKLNNVNFDFSGNEVSGSSIYSGETAIVQSRNHDAVSGNYKTFIFYNDSSVTSTLSTESSIRNTASGVSWKWERLQTDQHDASTPYVLDLGKVAVGASTQCTFKLHVRRSHTVGFARLKVPKNTLMGISSDVTAVSTGNADTWEEISLNFTPNQQGFVDVQVEFYATSTQSNVIVYIDDFEATQV